ncbi:MAG TPA: N-acetylneuraminate synthase family protein, partial [Vicinamibacteria bacterium]
MKSSFLINGRTVGKGAPCYVIAEAGVNHNCDVQLGYKLVETAGAAGADAIKFQSYTAGKIATRVAPRYWFEPADPQGTQWDSFDKLDKLTGRDFKSL